MTAIVTRRRLRREIVSFHARVLMAALVCAVVGTLAWPIWPWRGAVMADLQITALGERSPGSLGTEIWLNGLPAELSAARLARLSSSPLGWEARGSVLVSYRDQPATIALRAQLAPDGAFVFGRHSHSGRVAITINGQTRVLDLHAAGAGTPAIVRLDEFPAGAFKRFAQLDEFLIAVGLATMALFLGLSLIRLVLIRLEPGDEPTISFWRSALVLSLPSIVVFAVVLAGTWPGQMSPDSVSQWNELHTGSFGNAHPVIHTVLIGGPGYLFGTIGVSMAIQIVLLALAIGALCAEMERWRLPPAIVLACAVLTPMFPPVAILSTAFWKDIPYVIALAAAAAMTLAIARTDGAITKSHAFVAAFGIALFAAAAMRHNGVIVALCMTAMIAFVFRGRIRARVLAGWLAAGVVLPIVWTATIVPAIGIANPGRHYGGLLPMHLLAGMAAAEAPLPAETMRRMDAILPLPEWRARYDCLSAVPLFRAPGIRYDLLDASLMDPAIEAAMANPRLAIRHILCMNALNWRLSPPMNAQYTLTVLGIVADQTGVKPWSEISRPNLAAKAFVDGLFYRTISAPWSFALFWRPAAIFLALLTVAVLLGGWLRERAYLILLPVVFNTVSLAPLISSQDFRYQYVTYVVGLPAVFMLLGVYSLYASRRPTAGRAQAAPAAA